MQYDKSHESDKQMLARVGRKFAVIFIIIFMFDSLLDWLLGLIDLAVEGIHIIIEAIEYSVEILLGYTLHTDHQQSEIIIVNASIIIAIYVIYRLYIVIPRLYARLKNNFQLRISRNFADWHAMPLSCKIKLATAYSLGITCLFFLLTI